MSHPSQSIIRLCLYILVVRGKLRNMQFPVGATALLALASSAVGYVPEPTEATDLLAKASLQKLTDAVADGSLRELLATKGVSQDCNITNASIRRE